MTDTSASRPSVRHAHNAQSAGTLPEAQTAASMSGAPSLTVTADASGACMTQLGTVQREATPEQGALWQARYTTGYRHGRGDMLNGRDLRADCVLAEIPGELPGETGARYVARHVDDAYRIGYTRACCWYAAHAA